MSAPHFLDQHHLQLLFFGGKGGTGKTTSATATALVLAKRFSTSSFLLVSTDPAHSLVDCLDNLALPHNLETRELDSHQCLSEFKANHREMFLEIAERGTFLDNEDIEQIINLSLPGLDELMAFLKISKWVEDKAYDCIIVDTAPTGHTLRLLGMPHLIKNWLHALDVLLAKHRYMKELFSGSYQRDEIDAFIENLCASVKQMEALIKDPQRCQFIPVMLAEALSIQETTALLKQLGQSEIPVADIIVNRIFPKNHCQVCEQQRMRQIQALSAFQEKHAGYQYWEIPVAMEEVRGAKPLEKFWQNASALDILPSQVQCIDDALIDSYPHVEKPWHLPMAEARLLLFAGKGGVGKTTLACATAIRMAQDYPDQKTFLFSTDPAHSLSACLDIEIGPEPQKVTPGLTAMEIDASAEFEALKTEYAKELEVFLEALTPNMDLTFDRKVMESLMDLSPPGLDEVMALTMVIDFLAQDQYDTFILDAAPTGHLVRLLETPDLIDQWLKVVFTIFLKYKTIFRLPGITRRLINISRNLKQLCQNLTSTDQSAVYVVTLLREMAFAETKDLLAACNRIGVQTPVLFLNLVTKASKNPLCSALFELEAQVRSKFERTFTDKHQTLVYQGGEPRGLQQLGQLGAALYA